MTARSFISWPSDNILMRGLATGLEKRMEIDTAMRAGYCISDWKERSKWKTSGKIHEV